MSQSVVSAQEIYPSQICMGKEISLLVLTFYSMISVKSSLTVLVIQTQLLTWVHCYISCTEAQFCLFLWFIKKAEHWRTDASELWWWSRLLRAPWIARRSKQSNLKEISPEYSLEGLMLKLQYFGHLMWRAASLRKVLMLGKIEGRRRRGHRGWGAWMASSTLWTWVWASSERHGSLACCSPWGCKESDTTERLNHNN